MSNPHGVQRTTFPQPEVVPGFFQQSATLTVDLLTLAGLAFCLPFVILAVATPVILCAAVAMWIIARI